MNATARSPYVGRKLSSLEAELIAYNMALAADRRQGGKIPGNSSLKRHRAALNREINRRKGRRA